MEEESVCCCPVLVSSPARDGTMAFADRGALPARECPVSRGCYPVHDDVLVARLCRSRLFSSGHALAHTRAVAWRVTRDEGGVALRENVL